MQRNSDRQNQRDTQTTPLSRRRFIRATAATGVSALLALGRTGPVAASPDQAPLKVGILGPYSGPASDTGQAIRQGVIMALEDARAEGEVPLIIDGQSRDIELVWVDSASDPDQATGAITQAIADRGVALMLGGWHSDVALAAMDAEVPYHILHFGHLGEARTIAERINRAPGKYRGWFKGWPSPSRFAALYGAPINHFRSQGLWQPASDRAAVMVENSEYGRNWGEALLASLRQAGFQAQHYDLTGLDQTDFGALLDSYADRRVSLVAMTTTGREAAVSFVRQFRQHQLRALLLAHGLRWISNWHALTGDDSDFIVTMDSAMPIALWQRWWVRRYTSRFSQPPSIAAAGLHYDYARMAFRVLNATASLELDALVRTIHRTPYRGIWNRYRFATRPMPQTVSANEVITGRFMEGFFMPMAQLFGGKARIVWPSRYADQRFRSPPWT